MAPRIYYNNKVIDFPKNARAHRAVPRSPRTVVRSLSGISETIALPRVDTQVSLGWLFGVETGVTAAQLLAYRMAFEQWWAWAQQGLPWWLALESGERALTELSADAAAGNLTVVVHSSNGITAGLKYVLRDGPNHQMVEVESISGQTLTLSQVLNFTFGARSVLRSRSFWPGVLPADADWPIVDHMAADSPSFAAVPAFFDLNLDFYEDLNTLYAGNVGHWLLGEASGTREDSHALNDLLAGTSPGSAAGKQGNAADFEAGSFHYLEAPIGIGNPLQMGDVDMAVGCWVNLESKAASMLIVGQANASQSSWTVRYEASTDRFRFTIFDSAGGIAVDADVLGAPALATWYYIICWRDRVAGTINIQVNDGTANSTATTRYPQAIIVPLYVGILGGGTLPYDGLVDELDIWKRLPTATERTALYAAGAGLPFDSANAIWKL